MSVPPAFDLQGLLAEDQWIRRLARKLAGDPHAAEDLVQDTWAAALDSKPDAPRPRAPRPWLRGIVHNLWIDAKRARAARAQRELRAARPEALEPASELVAELELRKQVAEALLALEEPYRSALYLRFFKDQSLAAIARRQGVALSSAHERVQQGLARLRARLDQAHGGRRRAWALGLFALARPAGLLTRATEAIAMASGLKVAATVLVVGGGAAWYWLGSERETHPTLAEAPVADTASERDELAPVPAAPLPGAARAALPTEEPATLPSEPARAAGAAALVQGRVVDPEGAGLGAVRVGWTDSDSRAETSSAADGSFALAPASRGSIRALEPDLVTLVPGECASVGRAGSALLVVAPRAPLRGIVVDPDGAPVSGARLEFGLRQALHLQLGLVPSSLDRPEWHTTSADDGTFALAEIARSRRVLLHVEAVGFWMAMVDVPPASTSELVVRLQRAGSQRTIRGLVLDPAGVAVEGARVSAGDAIVVSDARGGFELALDGVHGTFGPLVGERPARPETEAHLVALKAGFLPAREPLASFDLAAPVVLQLGERPSSISGRVRESDGRPCAGVVVWTRDSTPFGRQVQTAGEGTTIAWQLTVEDELAGGPGRRGAVSDVEGAFEIPGLLARPYELMAFDPVKAELCGPWTITAGARGIELTLARALRRGKVAGQVVSVGGTSLAGVQITPRRTVPDTDAHGQVPYLRSHEVTTDALGRFEFAELALEGTTLQLQHASLGLSSVALAEQTDLEHLRIVEALLCELQAELGGDPGLVDAFAVLDAEQQELQLLEGFSGGWSILTQAEFTNGLSSVLRVPETAATLVLYKGGVEVSRRPLRLDPLARTTLRL